MLTKEEELIREAAKNYCLKYGCIECSDNDTCNKKNVTSCIPNHEMFESFVDGAEWQSKQPIPQSLIEEKLTEFFKCENIDDIMKFGSYSLVCISTMAIDANSEKTTISIEFTHKSGKKYKSEMLVTQHEILK
jgi:hypothetical protein